MEEALVILIIFGFIFAIVKLALDYNKDKHRSLSANPGSSLTTSELKKIVAEAIQEVLDERLDRLEERMEHLEEPRLIPAGKKEELELEHPASPPVARDRDTAR